MRSLLRKLIVFIEKIRQRLQELFELKRLNSLMPFFLTLFVVSFLSFSIFVNISPFRLFLPNLSFSIPAQDTRKKIELYAMERQDGELVRIQRKLLTHDDMFMRLQLLASLVSRPDQGLSIAKQEQSFVDVEKLPLLGNAIHQVWFFGERQLIIDLSHDVLNQEMARFHKNAEAQKDKNYYLKSFFTALNASVFATEKQVQSIRYLIDGKSAYLKEMKFNFARAYER